MIYIEILIKNLNFWLKNLSLTGGDRVECCLGVSEQRDVLGKKKCILLAIKRVNGVEEK